MRTLLKTLVVLAMVAIGLPIDAQAAFRVKRPSATAQQQALASIQSAGSGEDETVETTTKEKPFIVDFAQLGVDKPTDGYLMIVNEKNGNAITLSAMDDSTGKLELPPLALAELEMQYEKAKDALKTAAEKLSAKRKEVAVKLEKAIKQQLADLGMGRTEFEVEFRPASGIGENGSEEIEFMISPNPGEPLRPLATIASGGEVSRFMLAIKVILAENDGIGTMIFDEIDTGISGRMAQTVGEKMAMLGKDKQVICVTHLAQIAALADTQFLVEKSVQDGRTNSSVEKLSDEGRVEELVRLVGGAETDASGESHARSMLQAAAERKQNLRQ